MRPSKKQETAIAEVNQQVDKCGHTLLKEISDEVAEDSTRASASVSMPTPSISSSELDHSVGASQQSGHREKEFVELREQLGHKDELISALVAELEQVVEQVDRMQRIGVEKSRNPSGYSAGDSAGDQQVFGDLKRFVLQWDEIQPGDTLARIEAEIAGIRSLLTGGSLSLMASPHAARTDAAQPSSGDSVEAVISRLNLGKVTAAPETARHQSTSSSVVESPDVNVGSSWESMKKQMLGETEYVAAVRVESPQVDLEPEPDPTTDGAIPGMTSDFHLEGVVFPSPVAFESASPELLKKACLERDNYIIQLTKLIRARCAVPLPRHWGDIVGVPNALRDRTEELIARLDEQIRLAEVEMSLERARLSRERTQMQQERETVEKHLRRIGLRSLDELESFATENQQSSDRRWMRFLGSK